MAERQQPGAKSAKIRGGLVVPHTATLPQRLGAFVIWAALKAVTMTLRYRYVVRSDFYEQEHSRQAIYCVWHNRLALALKGYYSYARKRVKTPGMAAMASASKDGAFLAAIIERFGVQPVRGSSSRRGHQALLELTSWAERGWDLAITPDGPRGPRYIIQPGVMSLAQLTGLPIIPAVYNLSHKLQLKTWDRFQVPLPFSRCEVIIGQPLLVPRDCTDEEREALRLKIEHQLLEMTVD